MGFEHNQPAEFLELKKKFHKEVEDSLTEIWDNRRKLIMDIRLVNKWMPSHWSTLRYKNRDKLIYA